jgi:hypothetical protein
MTMRVDVHRGALKVSPSYSMGCKGTTQLAHEPAARYVILRMYLEDKVPRQSRRSTWVFIDDMPRPGTKTHLITRACV